MRKGRDDFLRYEHLPGIIVSALAFLVFSYTSSQAPFWGDSAELTASAYMLGVSHWPGYPLYNIIGHVFTLIPIGTVAYRMSIMSASFASLSCMMAYLILRRLKSSRLSASLGTVILAASYTFWSQANIAEVYSLAIFLLSVIIYSLIRYLDGKEHKWLYISSLCIGLSLSHHISIATITIPAFLYVAYQGSFKEGKIKLRSIKALALCAAIGAAPLLLYIYVPARSASDPAMDWGNPETLSNFMDLVTLKDIKFRFFTNSIWQTLGNAWYFLIFLFRQFGILTGLIIVGGYILLRRDRKALAILAIMAAMNLFTVLNFFSYDLIVHFLPTFFILALVIGYGIDYVFELAGKDLSTKAVAVAIVVMVMLNVLLYPRDVEVEDFRYVMEDPKGRNSMIYYLLFPPDLNRHSFRQSEEFADYAFSQLPKDAILITTYDDDTFTLWYYQEVEGMRPDVTVLYKDLLELRWYRENVISQGRGVNISLDGFDYAALVRSNAGRPIFMTRINPAFIYEYDNKTYPIERLN